MTIITPSRIRNAVPRCGARASGFTLVEILIGSTISAFVLAGILTTFLFLGRSGANLRNYSDMESQSRKALEMFAEDVRQASSITWNSSSSITLTVNSAAITYAYSSGTAAFSRTVGTTSTSLITGISSGTFAFKAYNVTGTELALATTANLTTASSSTKQLQISLEAARTSSTVSSATNLVLSARYILRNKIVTA